MTPSKSSAGFALLYAVLLTSVVLTVGLGLSSILRKQIILSSTGAASQQAYYAANTIKECVIHWGVHGARDEDSNFLYVFGYWLETIDEDTGATTFTYYPPENNPNEIECGNQTLKVEGDYSPSGPFSDDERIFSIGGSSSSNFEVEGACAWAVLTFRPANQSVLSATGYNVGCDDTDNPRRVERAIIDVGSL